MTAETMTTNEVAQALIDHTRLTNDGKCSCGFQGRLGESFAAHQAEALAEAGLLRTYDLDAECGVCGGTRDRAEVWRRQANRTDYALAEIMPTLRKIFSDATESERQMLDAFDVLIEQARDGKQQAQIATQEPAGATQGGSGDSRVSGGLGERLRALVAGPHPDMLLVRTAEEVWLAIVEQVDEVEAAYRAADAEINRLSEFHDHYQAQVERVRAQFVRMTKSSDEKTQQHGTALLHILDGKDAT